MGFSRRCVVILGLVCVIIGTKAGDVPSAPRVVAVKCEHTYVHLEWEVMDDDNGSSITKFLIQYNTTYNPEVWQPAPKYSPADQRQSEIPVNPWTIYSFRVVAINSFGLSLPSGHSDQCQAPANVPFSNPDDVTGHGNEPNNLIISWKMMHPIQQNGPGFFYRVSWKRKGNNTYWYTMDINDWETTNYVVQDVPTYMPFDIKVEAINDLGQANVTACVVTGFSGEDVPLEAPGNVTLVDITSEHSAIVKWEPVDADSVRGEFKGYKIESWTAAEGTGKLRKQIVPSDSTQFHIGILKPFAENLVQIYVFNDKYDGPLSDILSIVTPEGRPGPVEKFDAFPMDSGFRLVWKEPLDKHGILTSYQIDLTGDNVPTQDPIILGPEATKTKIIGLEPSTTYRFVLRAATVKGVGDPYYIRSETKNVSSTAPDKPVFEWDLIEDEIEQAAVKVTWIPDLNGNPGSHFYVDYKKQDETEFKRTDVIYEEDRVLINALQPASVYQIRIVAMNGNSTTPSDIQHIETPDNRYDVFQEYLRQYLSYYLAVLNSTAWNSNTVPA